MTRASFIQLIQQMAGTGVLSILLLLVLIGFHAYKILWWIAWPTISFGSLVAHLFDSIFPSSRGGWFPGLGAWIIVEGVLVWISIWTVLMVFVKLLEKYYYQRSENE